MYLCATINCFIVIQLFHWSVIGCYTYPIIGLLYPVVAVNYAIEAHKYLNLFINAAFMDNITIQ